MTFEDIIREAKSFENAEAAYNHFKVKKVDPAISKEFFEKFSDGERTTREAFEIFYNHVRSEAAAEESRNDNYIFLAEIIKNHPLLSGMMTEKALSALNQLNQLAGHKEEAIK